MPRDIFSLAKFANNNTTRMNPPPRHPNPPNAVQIPLPEEQLPPAVFAPVLALPPVPELKDSDPANNWQWNYSTIQAFHKAQATKPRKEAQAQWLQTERNWKDRVGKGWKPVRVLGRGGQGVVGHWTYDGPDRAQKALKDVAVKQAVVRGPTYKFGDGLETEAKILMLFQQSNSQHILRMYRHLYEDMGGGTDYFDHGVVHRIFLEYCAGGDLHHWLWGNYYQKAVPKNVPEPELWKIFHCLARGCLVMHHGREETNQPRWGVKEIAHLDLKLDNVLVSENMRDTEHRNAPAFKISDLGLAQETPSFQNQIYLDSLSHVGTAQWQLPEQIQNLNHRALASVYPRERPWISPSKNLVARPRYGTASNIWQIGLIMWVLMHEPIDMLPIWDSTQRGHLQCYQSGMTQRLRNAGATLGNRQDIDAESNPQQYMYSQALRAAVAECLLCMPAYRIGVEELVKRTGDQMNAQLLAMGASLTASFPPYREPELSQRWYSRQKPRQRKPPPPPPMPRPASQAANAPVPLFAQAAAQAAAAGLPPAPRLGYAQAVNAAAQIPVIPHINPLNQQPLAPMPLLAGNPSPNPGANGPLHLVPNPLPCIVQKKATWLNAGYHVTINIPNVSPTTTVRQVKNELIRQGVSNKMMMRHGLSLMMDNQKLGDFKALQHVRVMEM